MNQKLFLDYIQDAIKNTEENLRYLKFIEKKLAENNGTRISVQFAGCVKKYAYYVREGHVRVGDYVRVYSNYTNRKELVKVVSLNDSGYKGPLKEAELLSE